MQGLNAGRPFLLPPPGAAQPSMHHDDAGVNCGFPTTLHVQAKIVMMGEVLGPAAVAPLLTRLPVILTLGGPRFKEVRMYI